MKRTLLAAFVLLQVCDVLSTNAVLASGGWEANPLEVAAQTSLGAVWWLPKLALMCGLAVLMRRWPTGYVVIPVVFSAIVVGNNLMGV